MNLQFNWELIYKSKDEITETWRSKTIGGWLVKNFNCLYTDDVSDTNSTRRYTMSESMVFVSDLTHEWTISN